MAKCIVTGKKPLVGYKISHSHIKTKKRQMPNVQTKRIWDEETGAWVRLRVSTSALRTITRNGLSKTLKDAGLI